MVKELSVILNTPPNGVFFPGSVVSGELVVDVNEPKSYKSVEVALIGCGHVWWSEGSGSSNTQHTADETYVSLGAVLWSKEEKPDQKLPLGRHSFAFQFQALPENVPPTYTDPEQRGSFVKYYVEGRITTGVLRQDKVVREEIAVARVVDVNQPRLLAPTVTEDEGAASCFCCISPPITVTVNLPRTGYCVGDSIPVRVTINNRSSRGITLRAALVQLMTYQATDGFSDVSQRTLCGIASTDRMPPHTTTVWEPAAGLLQVPEVVTTMSTPGGGIHVLYSLRVTAVFPFSPDLIIDTQVIVGNVPLRPH